MSRKRKYNDEMLIEAVKKSISIRGISLILGLKYGGGSFRQIKNDILRLSLNTSHFKGQGHGKGGRTDPNFYKWLKEKSGVNRFNIKWRLIKEGLLVERCYVCGLKDTWNNKKIVMVLDHINGIKDDYRIENLRLLCPNCNSQTLTFSGRNIKAKLPKRTCKQCGVKIRKNKTGLCVNCFHDKMTHGLFKKKINVGKNRKLRTRKLHYINDNDLSDMVEKMSVIKIGRKLGVSPKTVMSECSWRHINIPNKSYMRKKFHVSKNKLKKLMVSMSMVKVGKIFGVSSVSIKKRAKALGICK